MKKIVLLSMALVFVGVASAQNIVLNQSKKVQSILTEEGTATSTELVNKRPSKNQLPMKGGDVEIGI